MGWSRGIQMETLVLYICSGIQSPHKTHLCVIIHALSMIYYYYSTILVLGLYMIYINLKIPSIESPTKLSVCKYPRIPTTHKPTPDLKNLDISPNIQENTHIRTGIAVLNSPVGYHTTHREFPYLHIHTQSIIVPLLAGFGLSLQSIPVGTHPHPKDRHR